MSEAILHCVFRAIDDINLLQPADAKVEKSAQATLVGSDGALDSMGLINLLLQCEQEIGAALSQQVSIVDLVASSSALEAGRLDVAALVQIIQSAIAG